MGWITQPSHNNQTTQLFVYLWAGSQWGSMRSAKQVGISGEVTSWMVQFWTRGSARSSLSTDPVVQFPPRKAMGVSGNLLGLEEKPNRMGPGVRLQTMVGFTTPPLFTKDCVI